MSVSQIDIANEALDLVGAATIVSLNDPTPEAGIVARALEPTIARVLQSYPWSCATTTTTLSRASQSTLASGEAVFELPSDCLRVLYVEAETWRTERVDSARTLVVPSLEAETLAVRYVAQITDPDGLAPLVRDLIVHELAIKVAAKLTESPQRIAALTRKAIQARKLAQANDARQNQCSGSPASASWADAFGVQG